MQAKSLQFSHVLVVEDDPRCQTRALSLLKEVAGKEARVDFANDLAQAKQLAAACTYDLALVDVKLTDGSGIDFIAWMHEHTPEVPSVVVTAWADEATILAALRNGAIGYLLKSTEDVELTTHLRSLQRGGAPIDPLIARRLLELMPQEPPQAVAPGPQIHLSPRERDVLQMVARGLSNREIAEATGLSKLTIESHTRNIYRKLAVGSRTAAVFEAHSLGLLD